MSRERVLSCVNIYLKQCENYRADIRNSLTERDRVRAQTQLDALTKIIDELLNSDQPPVEHMDVVRVLVSIFRIGTGFVVQRAQAVQVQKESAPTVHQILEENGVKIPDEYICPITMQIMQEPVILADGHMYEKSAIQKWFQTKNKSPLTNIVVDNKMIPCHCLKSLIQNFIQTNMALIEQKKGPKGPKKQKDTAKRASRASRAPTAYNLYVKSQFQVMKQQHPGLKASEIMKLIAQDWKNLPQQN